MSHAPPRTFKRSGAECLQWHARLLPLTRSHAQEFISRAYTRHTHACPLLYDVTPTNRFDRPGNRTRSESPAKKKKKKRERKCFDLVDLWPWPKSQNFQNGPVPLSFSSTFRFWNPFLHSKLKNCANVQFPKVDFCTNVDQKVKIFKKDLSYLIFRVDSIFGVYFFIWESEIAQIVWFYNCWP